VIGSENEWEVDWYIESIVAGKRESFEIMKNEEYEYEKTYDKYAPSKKNIHKQLPVSAFFL